MAETRLLLLPWDDQGTAGIFWDYENVPLRQKDGDLFLEGLQHFIRLNNVSFARLYCHEMNLPAARETQIRVIPPFDVKFTSLPGPNAADQSLIQSCINVLQNHKDINHVVILTGDADFRELLAQLKNWDVRVTLICQEQNYSPELVDEAHHAYAVSYVAEFPTNWWTTLPQSELETIREIQYTPDAMTIPPLLSHLDPTKPYHASAALSVLIALLDRVMRNPTAAESLKAAFMPALLDFEVKLAKSPQKDLLTQLEKVLEKIERNDTVAILQLGEEKPPGALEKLLPFLQHPDLNHRQDAIVALGNLGDPRARPSLEAMKQTILEKIPFWQMKSLDPDVEHTLEYIDKALAKIPKN